MNTDSAAGKPSSRGMKIGFLLVGSPEKERVYAVLAALPLLEGVSTVRLAWSDASQAEFSGMSSFSASPGELIDRLSDELLHLPGFQVQIQGVNRVPYPVLVFRAEPGVMDRNAVRRRSTARTGLVQQEEARRGTARIDRPQAGTQPGRTGGAGVTPDPEAASPETAASGETPPETTWAPGLMASTVREPGFENVTPRLHPAARPRPDPIEPVVRSHYPRPSPVDETGQSTPGAQGIPDAREDDWRIDVSEETDESVPQDTETIGAVVLEPGELLEEDDTAWLVLVSDSYPDIEYPEQPSERLHTAVPGAVRGAVEVSEEKAARQKFAAQRRPAASRARPPRRALWERAIIALFGEIGPDTQSANDQSAGEADDIDGTGTAATAQSDSRRGDHDEGEPTAEADGAAADSRGSEGPPNPDPTPDPGPDPGNGLDETEDHSS
ncbi:MAG: hypothetical protein IIB28_05925 [Chloroflexi bacterium]|nr:hypothetical protein [Chloroflexota bacterium]